MELEDTDRNYIESLFSSKELYKIVIENAGNGIFFTEESKIIEIMPFCNFQYATLPSGAIAKKNF